MTHQKLILSPACVIPLPYIDMPGTYHDHKSSLLQVKQMWKPDDSTVIVLLDPSSPNVLNFSAGRKVLIHLHRRLLVKLIYLASKMPASWHLVTCVAATAQVRELLSAPFFTELKSKYGNVFFVRDYGEQVATLQLAKQLSPQHGCSSLHSDPACRRRLQS